MLWKSPPPIKIPTLKRGQFGRKHPKRQTQPQTARQPHRGHEYLPPLNERTRAEINRNLADKLFNYVANNHLIAKLRLACKKAW